MIQAVFPGCLWVYCLVPQGITVNIPPASLLISTPLQSQVISVAEWISVSHLLFVTYHKTLLQPAVPWCPLAFQRWYLVPTAAVCMCFHHQLHRKVPLSVNSHRHDEIGWAVLPSYSHHRCTSGIGVCVVDAPPSFLMRWCYEKPLPPPHYYHW